MGGAGEGTTHVLWGWKLLPCAALQEVGALSSEHTCGQCQAGTPGARPGALTVRSAAFSGQLGVIGGRDRRISPLTCGMAARLFLTPGESDSRLGSVKFVFFSQLFSPQKILSNPSVMGMSQDPSAGPQPMPREQLLVPPPQTLLSSARWGN